MEEHNLNEKQNKISLTDRCVVYAVSAMILIFVTAFFVSDKKTFSENENRTLAKVPQVSFENICGKRHDLNIRDSLFCIG